MLRTGAASQDKGSRSPLCRNGLRGQTGLEPLEQGECGLRCAGGVSSVWKAV